MTLSDFIKEWLSKNNLSFSKEGKKIIKNNFLEAQKLRNLMLNHDYNAVRFLSKIPVLPSSPLPNELPRILWLTQTMMNPILPGIDSYSRDIILSDLLQVLYSKADLFSQLVFYMMVIDSFEKSGIDRKTINNDLNALYYKSLEYHWKNGNIKKESNKFFVETISKKLSSIYFQSHTKRYFEVGSTWVKEISFQENYREDIRINNMLGIFINNMQCTDGIPVTINKTATIIPSMVEEKITPLNWTFDLPAMRIVFLKKRYYCFSYDDIIKVCNSVELPSNIKIQMKCYGNRAYLIFFRNEIPFASIVNTPFHPYVYMN